MAINYITSTAKEVLSSLNSGEQGLTNQEAKIRLEKFGLNKLHTQKGINPIKLFFNQFKDVLILVLIGAAAVSFAVGLLEENGHITESVLIMLIVLAIAVIGFLNEFKAEKTVEALKKLVGYSAKVRRDNQVIEIPVEQIVPGDIVLIDEGQKVSADIRLIEANSVRVNEASLTGESLPVSKNTEAAAKVTSLGDQENMLFSGTFVTSGSGYGVAIATGSSTEIGKIAKLVSSVEPEQTPMQRKLDELGKKIGKLVLLVAIAIFIIIFLLNPEDVDGDMLQRLLLAFTAAVALAVAAIPEGLSFVVRISLALGARRMAAKNALVRKLSAVEALGSTDVICTDKTGTLTKGEMVVRSIFTNEKTYQVTGNGYEINGDYSLDNKNLGNLKELTGILQIGALCNNAHLKKDQIIGDPTEAALLVSAAKAKLDLSKLLNEFPRLSEIPFSSERKKMTTVHKHGSGFLVATKGAPESVLAICDHIEINSKVKKLTPAIKKDILEQNQQIASQALRVLGFAYKNSSTEPKGENAEKGLTFVGLQGMMDPPRQEVKEVMGRVSGEAGMRVLMITGDYIETAKAVAKEIGIEGDAISGAEIEEMDQATLASKIKTASVFARVNPEHKIRIVQALKKQGHQVAMTGDGVNDAPALKAADIGISMGITGTDAAKEASDIILLDDQFLTIIGAIEEGRGIFDNMRKFVNYLLSANIAEVITVVGGVIVFGKLVLSATQLLFINIVTDGLPAVALGSDPSERNVMRLKPSAFQGSIINKRIWIEMITFGLLMSAALLTHYWYIILNFDDTGRAAAVAFTAMVVYEMVRLVDIRTDYKIKWFSNLWLSVAMAGSLALLLAVVYITPLANIFKLGSIQAVDWVIIVVTSVCLFIAMKILNVILNRLSADGRSL
ncbi:cation-translocating P-type ATPase [Candidatus Saccharibacteria bacterium]|nr:cation-translocating P-type ATPase [Candidatus Saccharibacteria bacterium]